MNITFFLGGLSGGGAERVCCNLANRFCELGHSVDMLVTSDESSTYELNKQVHITTLLPFSKRKNKAHDIFTFFRNFVRYVKNEKKDLYIVMTPVSTILLLLLRNKTNAKVIASERNTPSRRYSKFIQFLIRRVAHRADGWVYQTQENASFYNGYINECKSIIIPNPISEIPEYQAGERRKVIVNAGRLTSQKNQALLIASFASIAKDFDDYLLKIYGSGEKKEELLDMISNMNLEGRVEICEYTSNLFDEIHDVSLFVLSSDYEGMPNALMEAMCLGLPCVSTDCGGGGAKALITNGVDGLLVPPNDASAMSMAMSKMLSDMHFAEMCGNNAKKIKERLSPELIYGEWWKFIDSVVTQ